MIRQIVLDTETTGLKAHEGDRIVEIGAVELVNQLPTDKHFHVYINPEIPMPTEAFAIHGLGDDFLADKPTFAGIAQEFTDFLADSELVIHNAGFDIGFINAELARLSIASISMERVVDTLALARVKFPGRPNSLDALCARFGIDNSARSLHGALLDASLLVEVYIELMGGRQHGLGLVTENDSHSNKLFENTNPTQEAMKRVSVLPSRLDDKMKEQHRNFIEDFPTKAIWQDYLEKSEA